MILPVIMQSLFLDMRYNKLIMPTNAANNGFSFHCPDYRSLFHHATGLLVVLKPQLCRRHWWLYQLDRLLREFTKWESTWRIKGCRATLQRQERH